MYCFILIMQTPKPVQEETEQFSQAPQEVESRDLDLGSAAAPAV